MYSFLFVNESVLKYSAAFLFFFKAMARSSGNFTSLVCPEPGPTGKRNEQGDETGKARCYRVGVLS